MSSQSLSLASIKECFLIWNPNDEQVKDMDIDSIEYLLDFQYMQYLRNIIEKGFTNITSKKNMYKCLKNKIKDFKNQQQLTEYRVDKLNILREIKNNIYE